MRERERELTIVELSHIIEIALLRTIFDWYFNNLFISERERER